MPVPLVVDVRVNLEHLDQKLWVALACPTSGLEFDSKTLALIDTDKDGRIRYRQVGPFTEDDIQKKLMPLVAELSK